MRQQGEVTIEGKSSANVVILDKPTARTFWFHLMGNPDMNQDGAPVEFSNGNLENIARHALEEIGDSTHFSRYTKVGGNTHVFGVDYERGDMKWLPSVRKNPEEIYIVIPSGARVNGRFFDERVIDRIPERNSSGIDPELFFNFMRTNGYDDAQSIQIYCHLMGHLDATEIPHHQNPALRPKNSDVITLSKEAAVGAGLAVLIVALTAGGIYRVNKTMNSPRYKSQVEEAALERGTNVHDARYGR